MSLTESIQRRLIVGGASLSLLALAGVGSTIIAQNSFAQTSDADSTATATVADTDATSDATPTADADASPTTGDSGSTDSDGLTPSGSDTKGADSGDGEDPCENMGSRDGSYGHSGDGSGADGSSSSTTSSNAFYRAGNRA